MNPTEKIRAFVSIFPPKNLAGTLENFQQRIHEKVRIRAIRWTRPEQIHLTLHFFGSIESERIETFQNVLQNVASRNAPFTVRVEGLGCFPSAKHPRILWAGLSDEHHALEKLKADVDEALVAIGCETEDRKFHPHLTLSRLGEIPAAEWRQLAEALASLHSEPFGDWKIQQMELTQSKLSSGGSSYSALKIFPFGRK